MTFRETAKQRPRWRRLLGPFAPLNNRQLVWVHFLWVLNFWAAAMLIVTPKAVEISLEQPILSIWTGLTMFGTLVAMLGLIMSSYPPVSRAHVLALSVELFGLYLTIVGPFVYFSTQLYLLISGVEVQLSGITRDAVLHNRLALSLFAYAMVVAVFTRISIVHLRWKRQWRKEVKG